MNQENNPLVSIITPNFNGGLYLEETIKSVLNQTYNNIEYIIVDGASSDNSLEIISKYKEKISKIISEPDNGMYDAINKGMKLSKGSIIAYINSDDFYPKNIIANVVNFFNKYSNVDLVYGDLIYVDKNSKIIRKISYPNYNLKCQFASNYSLIGQPSSFWRKRLIDNIGIFNNKYKFAGDHDFYIKSGLNNVIKHDSELISFFRIHELSLTNNNKQLSLAEVSSIQKNYNVITNPLCVIFFRYYSNFVFKVLNIKNLTLYLITRFYA